MRCRRHEAIKRTPESNVAQPLLGGLELAVARAREDEGRRPRVHADGDLTIGLRYNGRALARHALERGHAPRFVRGREPLVVREDERPPNLPSEDLFEVAALRR